MYDAVRSLLRVLEDGSGAKLRLDAVIDACASMQNLREAIGVYRSRMLREQVRRCPSNTLLQHCLSFILKFCTYF
jgi:hypothetical protein